MPNVYRTLGSARFKTPTVTRETVFNVMDYHARADNSHDDSGPIQAAIDAAEAVTDGTGTGGGTVFFPAGVYRVTKTITVTTGGIMLLGEGDGLIQGFDTGNPTNSTSNGVTVIYLDNGGSDFTGAIIHFAPIDRTGADKEAQTLRSCGMDGIMVSGRIVGGSANGQPEFGVLIENNSYFRGGSIRAEFCRVAGLCLRGMTGTTSGWPFFNRFERIFYTWGTKTARDEANSFAVIVGNSADSVVQNVQNWFGDLHGLYYNGGGMQFVGASDNNYIERLQVSGQTGAFGHQLHFAPGVGGGARNHQFHYTSGPVWSESTDANRNVIEHFLTEGSLLEIASTGQLHIERFHSHAHGDGWTSPKFLMKDELHVHAQEMISLSSASLAAHSTAMPSWHLPDAADNTVEFVVRAPQSWHDGQD